MSVGANIRAARRRKGWKQEHLARLASLSRTALSDIENGYAEPKTSTLRALARALEVSTDELLQEPSPAASSVLQAV